MGYSHYERLKAIDAAFLELEEPSVHMHVGAIALFESEALRDGEGRLDIERIRSFVHASLHDMPRFRQRLVTIPVFDHPVWTDDPRFNLAYHVRHSALPAPGDVRQLKRLAGRIMSQKLDRGKPLWEMWVVEGLADGRIALVTKVHHCMVDGISGIELFATLLRLEPDASVPEDRRWIPRPAPSPERLLRDELSHRASAPFSVLRGLPSALAHPRQTYESLRESSLGVGETVAAGFTATTNTPLNVDIGPYRRFDWAAMEISDIKEIRKRLGGTLNDVVLCTVAGGVGRFLRRRGMDLDPETAFRVMVPVSIRTESQRGTPGNRVVNYLERLPVDERDPCKRLERTVRNSRALKDSRVVKGAETIEELGDRTFTAFVVQLVRLTSSLRTYNLVVTNVPGPQRPLYLLGARMSEIYPLVPLFLNQGLGIALFSYDGRLYWGFNSDWDALPDLHDLVDDVELEFGRLLEAATTESEPKEEAQEA